MNIDLIWPPRACTECGLVKSIGNFNVASWARDLLTRKCSACINIRNWRRRKANPNQKEIDRKFNLRFGFGITVAEYDALLEEQSGVCAICKLPETALRRGFPKRLAVDHCHVTNTNRGLLCSRCNVAIGYFRDSPKLLRAAISYLNQYQPKERTS